MALRGQKIYDILVHVGAGACRQLPIHLETAHRVLLLEPERALHAALHERLCDEPRVEILRLALGEGDAERVFSVRNIPELSGFCAPSRIKQGFRGLAVTESYSAMSLDAGRWLDALDDRRHLGISLVVETNGDERNIVTSLVRSGWLAQLSQVTIACGEDPLFDNGFTVKEAISTLEAHGHISVNNLGFESSVVLDVHKPSKKNYEVFEGPIASLLRARRELQTALVKQVKIAMENKNLQLSVEGLTAQIKANQEKFENELCLQRQMTSDALEELSLGRDDLGKQLKSVERRLLVAQEQLSAKGHEIEDLSAHVSELERDKAALHEEVIPHLEENLSLALRNQTMVTSDLSALRRRYSDLYQDEREAVEKLLVLEAMLDPTSKKDTLIQAESRNLLSDLTIDGEPHPGALADKLPDRET